MDRGSTELHSKWWTCEGAVSADRHRPVATRRDRLVPARRPAPGLPARVGLADVKNHLATPRLIEMVGTDVFGYHGYVEVMPKDTWVKATPTFNTTLCQKLGVPPLDFSGDRDARLQPFDATGRMFMTYIAQHGTFFDVPTKYLMAEMKRLYPKLCQPGGLRGSMEEEARR